MHRFRFKVPDADYRPVAFPPEGPYWCSGTGDGYSILIAYSPDVATLTCADRWPDAFDVEDQGESDIVFTDRFARPEWWTDEMHAGFGEELGGEG